MSFRKQKQRASRALAELKMVKSRLKKQSPGDGELNQSVADFEQTIKAAIKDKDETGLADVLDQLEQQLDEGLAPYRPNPTWEFMKAIVIALIIALFIRWGFVETFRIPSGSMIPTLLVGDQLMVNKMVFGPNLWVPVIDPDLSEQGVEKLKLTGSPRHEFKVGDINVVIVSKKLWLRRLPHRGEVVVFIYPRDPFNRSDPTQNYIKRVIGLPGDQIEIKEGELYINGQLQKSEKVGPFDGPVGERISSRFDLFAETLTSEPHDRTHDVLHLDPPERRSPYWTYGPVTVPGQMLLCMGDNRDRSSDSRYWGFVPVSHLKGTAMFIHLPLDPENHYLPRWGRFFRVIR